MSKYLYTDENWTIDKIEQTWEVLDKIAKKKYGLEYYSPQIEIVSADQMMERHACGAMPLMYHHWSFGKAFLQLKKSYDGGQSSLAYETIINTNPTLAFIMEDNNMTMQALVLAHAVCGHGSFFTINRMFLEHTDADYILDYLAFAREYINKCEQKYGPKRVEQTLDACHALQLYGVNKTTRTRSTLDLQRLTDKTGAVGEPRKRKPFTKIMKTNKAKIKLKKEFDWPFPEENLLYFIEKNSPSLEDWQKEIVRIVRQISQYFYPQYQTKLMNEGWASFWHHTLMTDLWEQGYITEGSYLEFLASHTAVCCQRGAFECGGSDTFNPYALGFAMYKDIQRICQDPTDEDREWMPDIAGTDWVETIKEITRNHRDDSFVAQYLSPKVIRDFKMFSVRDSAAEDEVEVTNVQDQDYKQIRRILSKQYNFNSAIPDMEVVGYDFRGDRALFIRHNAYNGKELDVGYAKATAKHIKKLWRKPIYIESHLHGENVRVCKLDY